MHKLVFAEFCYPSRMLKNGLRDEVRNRLLLFQFLGNQCFLITILSRFYQICTSQKLEKFFRVGGCGEIVIPEKDF